MENASKALIIAGAILVSILIISVGVMIFNQGKDAMDGQQIDDITLQSFNGKFDTFAGKTIRGSTVKQLIKTASNHNRTETDTSKKVVVMEGEIEDSQTQQSDSYFDNLSSNGSCAVKDDGSTTDKASIGSGSVYTVKCVYSKNSGLIRAVYFHKNNS